MTHNMKLRREPFDKIARGEKTIELRLLDEKRRTISTGDTIVFTCADDAGCSLHTRVVALHVFADFDELYRNLPHDKCGYSYGDVASHHDMEQYYSLDEQARYGVIGIELELL